jgi:hypothetical protein
MGVKTANRGNHRELSNFLSEISSVFVNKEIAFFCDVSPRGLRNVFRRFGKKNLYKFLGPLRCWKQHAPLNRR